MIWLILFLEFKYLLVQRMELSIPLFGPLMFFGACDSTVMMVGGWQAQCSERTECLLSVQLLLVARKPVAQLL